MAWRQPDGKRRTGKPRKSWPVSGRLWRKKLKTGKVKLEIVTIDITFLYLLIL